MSLPEQRIFVEEAEDDPDGISVWMDGEVICTFSHDAIGWAGFEAIGQLVERIQQIL